ncbi:MAG: hypothetical protein ACFFER_13170 [Candidatus Thorarchaeota archaeon]
MLTFTEQGVDADIILSHAVLLHDVWKKMRPWWLGHLRYNLAKAWGCGQKIIAFSTWMINQSSLPCILEYHKESQVCTVTVSIDPYGHRRTEEKVTQALRIVLSTSN